MICTLLKPYDGRAQVWLARPSHLIAGALRAEGRLVSFQPHFRKMAAARERWVWHISPHFLVLLTQHYQNPGWPIRLLENIISILIKRS